MADIFPSRCPRALVPDYLIGTVHQAKGLEFDTVLIADDFVKVPCPGSDFQRRTNFTVGEGTLCVLLSLIRKRVSCQCLFCKSTLSGVTSASGCPCDYWSRSFLYRELRTGEYSAVELEAM